MLRPLAIAFDKLLSCENQSHLWNRHSHSICFVLRRLFCTGRNHHPFRVDFSPNNMLLLSLDRVNGLLLPMKIEPGVGSVGGHEHGEGS